MVRIIEMTTEEYEHFYGTKTPVEEHEEKHEPKPERIPFKTRTVMAMVKNESRKSKRYSKSEIRIMRQNRHLKTKELVKLLPGRNIEGIKNKMFLMFGTSKPKKMPLSESESSKRMKFIGKEMAKLMKEDPKLTRKDASKLASSSYKKGG